MTMIEIKTQGQRHYLVGNTFPIRDTLKAAGFHFDRDNRSWWTGKRELAETILSALAEGKVKVVASFAKLPNGTWGARVAGPVAAGDKVEIEGRFGRKTATIAEVVETRDGFSICSLAAEPRKPRKSTGRRSSMGGRCRECGGPVKDAPHHRAMGGLCGGCAFDEFDC